MDKYLTTAEVCRLLGVKKSRITVIARKRNWQWREVPSGRRFPAKEYLASDVYREVDARNRPPET